MKSEKPEDVVLDRPFAEIWNDAVERIKSKVSKPTYEAWLSHMQPIELTQTTIKLAVRNDFAKNRFYSLYRELIEGTFSELLGRTVNLEVVIDSTLVETPYTPSIASITVMPAPEQTSAEAVQQVQAGQQQGQQPPSHKPSPNIALSRQMDRASGDFNSRIALSNLNPKHVFETYVVGSSNRFSHAAALAVADKPGQAYNPLFLYGGVGLGKTHLLHAIGNAMLQRAPNTVIRYMSCEKFTNDVINSIRDGKMVDFRKRYRQIDLLLMDDIQFIEGKESTQEEFFHTFNHLRDNGKQIVLTSDRPPKSLAKLEERLRSRFEWGLITDIQAPDYEMRLAILQKKATQENMFVSHDVLEYIASNFTSNIRELEGALLRAHAYYSFSGSNVSLVEIAPMLNPGGQKKKDRPPITIDKLIDAVSSYYRVESADIKSEKRSQDLTVPRHVAMYLAHEMMSLSFPRIGQALNRKHTSVLYAHNKVKSAISEDPEIAQAVREIARQLDA